MDINGTTVSTLEELEVVIADMPDATKTYLRNMFNGVSNYSAPSQEEIDKAKYEKRASALGKIISQMATNNMARVRSGAWTVPQLISLTQDPQLKEILTDLYALSFEIAYSKIDAISNSLVTPDIKNEWKTLLYLNF